MPSSGGSNEANAHTAKQRLDQKRMDEVKRIRYSLEAGDSPLNEAKRCTVLEHPMELGNNEGANLQEVLISIAMEGNNDPVL
jgi:hypothetical protein